MDTRKQVRRRPRRVFGAELPGDDREEIIQKLIYRSDLPYRPEFSAISYRPS